MPNRHIITGQKIDPAKLQRAKALRRNMTPAEKRLWTALRANRLQGFHFRRQQIIDGFIVDFYCHAAGLVVEVDGPVHDQQADYDAERDRVLSARGLRILRVHNSEVMQDLKDVLARIEAACKKELAKKLPSPRRGGAGGELPSPRREGATGELPSPRRGGAGGELPSPRRGGAGGGVP